MIYSRWRPDRGGYDYFESTERRGLGDDLPVPKLGPKTPLGVASTDAGRLPRGRLRRVGSGALARGAILPLSRAGLSGLGAFGPAPAWAVPLLIVGASAAAGWYAVKRRWLK